MMIEERAMKRTTLVVVMVSLLGTGALGGAQTPAPTPPAPIPAPTPEAAPYPARTPSPKAKPARPTPDEWSWESEKARAKREELRWKSDVDRDEMEKRSREMRDQSEQIREQQARDREQMLRDAERMREEQARDREQMRLNDEITRAEMQRAREKMNEDRWRVELDAPKVIVKGDKYDLKYDRFDVAIAPLPAMKPVMPMPALAPIAPMKAGFGEGFSNIDGSFLNKRPPEAWLQGDPADSLFRVAREALNRGEYRRAAELFSEVTRRYPNSGYAPTCGYWEAFSRYRIGTTEELQLASRALDVATARYSQISREADVSGLRTRIDGVLASRGDVAAASRVRQRAREAPASSTGEGDSPCDKEDIQVRAEALSALAQMDPNGALPTLRRVLDRTDECSVQLRRSAAMMLARRADSASAAILANVARNDASLDVRVEAIQWLPRMPGTIGLNAIEEVLRTSDEERVQRAAIGALMSSDNPRARSSVRAILERRDASERLRVEALSRYDRDRSNADDAAFLKALYALTESERVKESILNAIARIGGNDDFLMGVVRSENEPYAMRAAALGRVSRSGTISIADLSRLYDAADSRGMREQIINALAGRKETEATDKLVDIAKNSTDYNARRMAISAL